jgi:hypothetical protein
LQSISGTNQYFIVIEIGIRPAKTMASSAKTATITLNARHTTDHIQNRFRERYRKKRFNRMNRGKSYCRVKNDRRPPILNQDEKTKASEPAAGL